MKPPGAPDGAKICLLTSRKSPTSSVCSMLSEGMRNGCSTNVSRNSATTTVLQQGGQRLGHSGQMQRQRRDGHLVGPVRRNGPECSSASSCSSARSLAAAAFAAALPAAAASRISARRAASCSACFLVLPVPRARGLPGSPSAGLETHLDQKALAVVGTALALDPVDRRAGARSLQTLLQRGLVVAQRGTGAQLLGQLLHGSPIT